MLRWFQSSLRRRVAGWAGCGGMMWGWMQLKIVKMGHDGPSFLSQKYIRLPPWSRMCWKCWMLLGLMSNVYCGVCPLWVASHHKASFLYQTDPSFERSVRFWRLTGPIAWSLIWDSRFPNEKNTQKTKNDEEGLLQNLFFFVHQTLPMKKIWWAR